MIALTIALALVSLICLVLIVNTVRKERELRRMAQFLSLRSSNDNSRIHLEMRTRGLIDISDKINIELDRARAQKIEYQKQEHEFKQGLTELSHDIRTPLAGAQGYLQLLAMDDERAMQQQYLSGISRRLSDLRYLLDQLFLYTQVSDVDYSLKCEELDANQLLGKFLVEFYPQFKQFQWEPVVELSDDNCLIEANSEAVLRIFRNLISNMLRHGSASPKISQSGKSFLFENHVANPQILEVDRLFERFYCQAVSGESKASTSEKGSGLGLAIVSQLAHAMGAKVSAKLTGDILQITIEFR